MQMKVKKKTMMTMRNKSFGSGLMFGMPLIVTVFLSFCMLDLSFELN